MTRAWVAVAALGAMPLAARPSPAQQSSPMIAEVIVEGTRTLDPERIRALSGLTRGSVLTQRSLREAVRSLWKTNLFNEIAVTTRPGSGGLGMAVIVEVVEAPVITRLDFEGEDKVDRDDLEAALGLRPGDRLLKHRLHQAEIDLERLYQERGYFLADARLAAGTLQADSTALSIVIDEGRKVAVKGIEFHGNDALSAERLREALETDTEGFWFWQDGEFDEATWRTDLAQRLPTFYGSHGYIDLRVVSDSMAVDPGQGTIRLYVTVDEGPQYRTGEVAIEGNNRFSRADLKELLRLEPGNVFDTQVVDATESEILNLYADDGYIYARVMPVRSVRPDTAIVDLTWQIREGDPAHIRHVAIRGNTVTHESVVRRQLFVQPGERFRRTDVRNSLLALDGLGFFEPGVIPTTNVVDEETGNIDLTFEVEERRTGSLTLGAAVGGGTGLSGFLAYEQPNLFGQARSGSIRWEFGSRNNNLEVSYSEPIFLGSTTSASVSFFDIDRRYVNRPFRQDAIGANLRFGTPLPWDDASRILYGYKWQRIDLEATDGSDDLFQAGEYPRTESSVNLSLVRDTRLPRRHPIQGARHSLSMDVAGGLLLGNVGFQKYLFETSWYAPTFSDRTVLNLSLETGGINATSFVPLTEQFVLGGVQYPSEGLRGYDEGCVGLINAGTQRGVGCGGDPGNGYLLLTAEHFFKITDTIYASVFYDAGDVFREFRAVSFADLKRGAGIGATIELPGLGPLGLDYGYGFDRLDANGNSDPGWQLHFRFGNLVR